MECKSACIASATSQAIELIDTLWNVNRQLHESFYVHESN